jgi:hypothetical protein
MCNYVYICIYHSIFPLASMNISYYCGNFYYLNFDFSEKFGAMNLGSNPPTDTIQLAVL